MILHALTVHGVLAFPETVSVDFDAIPPGLVAVSGPNGAGKSSFLEAAFACLYRRFPSRSGALVDYATRRDAALSLTFTIPGRGRYRATVRLDHVSRASSAVLEQLPDGAGAPLILNDGKVSTYDQVIAGLVPPPELLLASAFAAQSRAGSFLQASRTERRALFATLLGLDHYERLAETAKTVRSAYVATRDTVVGMHTAMSASDPQAALAAVEATLATATEDLAAVNAQGEALRALTEPLQAAAAEAMAHATAAREVRARVQQHASALTVLEVRASGLTSKQAMGEQHRARRRQEIDAERDRAVTDLTGRLTNNRTLLEHADEIRANADAEATRAADLDAAETAYHQALAQQQAASQALAAVRQQQTAYDADLSTIRLLDTVPCRGDSAYAGCAFLARAIEARTRVNADVSVTLGQALRAAEDELAATSRFVETISARRAALSQARDPKAIERLERLKSAETRVRELEADITAAEQRRLTAIQETDAAFAQLCLEIDAERATLAYERMQAAAALQAAEAEQARYIDAEGNAQAAQAALHAHQQALVEWKHERQRRGEAILAAQGQRKTALDTLAKITRLETVRCELDAACLTWGIVIDACSRTGIPTLEMDAAGPTVSAYCNDLLRACFGGRFSVDLITEDQKADGKGTKEVFEIRVYDADRNGAAVDIMDLSGGERVIVDEALKCAIAQLVNERAAWPLCTLWRDETTGALDPVNATRYVDMLRRLAQRTAVHHVLFITHMPEAARLADAQIHVGGGRLRVAFPPYPQEA